MANIKRCDLCGKEYSKTFDGCTLNTVKYFSDSENKHPIHAIKIEIDICKECYDKVIQPIVDAKEEYDRQR